jgi:hypothetical protein
MASAEVNVRIADLPAMRQFIDATAGLIRSLAGCEGLPGTVMDAADQVRLALAALGGKDIGPPPSQEEIICRAMTEAQENPGRIVTVEG